MIMKKFHRALALFLPVLLLCLHTVPAHAAEYEPTLTDEELYEMEFERLLTEGYDDQAALWSLDDRDPDRTFEYDGVIYFTGANWSGWPQQYPPTSNNSDVTFSPSNYVEVDWQGGGGYRIGGGTHRIATASYQLYVEAGTFVDYYAPSVYAYRDGGSLTFSGTVVMKLAETWYNSSAFISNDVVSSYGGVEALPDRMALMVNGDIVTSITSSGNGVFQLNYEYELTEPVYSVGYRFYYDTTQHLKQSSGVSNIYTLGLYLWLDDNALVTEFVPEQYVPLFKEVITEVKQIPATIYNFFFGEDGEEAASSFKDSVDDAVGSGEQVRDEIDALVKPDPDAIVPDIQDHAPLDQYTAYTGTFGALMENDTIVKMMLVALAFAFGSYVLFGKKV